MRRTVFASLAVFGLLFTQPAAADGPKVVASIKPVHAFVAGLMAGVGEPDLIVKGAASPHTFSLRPSDAKAIANADLVVWVGEALERPLGEAIESLSGKTKVIELLDLDMASRRKGYDHGHDSGNAAKKEHGGHGHGNLDPHVWLNPDNGHAILHAVADALAGVDPKNRARYMANLETMNERLEVLERDLEKSLAPYAGKPFVVFHDAYGYFTDRLSLGPVTAVTVNPERKPGARRVAEVRAEIAKAGARCIFAEPQFSPAIVKTIAEGTNIRHGVLDPVGADLPPGADLYFTLMTNLAKSLADCLGG